MSDVTYQPNIVASERRRVAEEAAPYVLCAIAAILFFSLALRDMWRQHQLELDAERGTVVPNVSASMLLDGRDQFLGDPKAAYTLVEFGDYQCPYCRSAQHAVRIVLDKYKGRVKLDFRQLPLRRIHRFAAAAADAAESARASGKFWQAHEELYSTAILDQATIAGVLSGIHVTPDPARADAQIAADAELANKFAVRGTPTFFLCCPGQSVVRLPNVGAVRSSLR